MATPGSWTASTWRKPEVAMLMPGAGIAVGTVVAAEALAAEAPESFAWSQHGMLEHVPSPASTSLRAQLASRGWAVFPPSPHRQILPFAIVCANTCCGSSPRVTTSTRASPPFGAVGALPRGAPVVATDLPDLQPLPTLRVGRDVRL